VQVTLLFQQHPKHKNLSMAMGMGMAMGLDKRKREPLAAWPVQLPKWSWGSIWVPRRTGGVGSRQRAVLQFRRPCLFLRLHLPLLFQHQQHPKHKHFSIAMGLGINHSTMPFSRLFLHEWGWVYRTGRSRLLLINHPWYETCKGLLGIFPPQVLKDVLQIQQRSESYTLKFDSNSPPELSTAPGDSTNVKCFVEHKATAPDARGELASQLADEVGKRLEMCDDPSVNGTDVPESVFLPYLDSWARYREVQGSTPDVKNQTAPPRLSRRFVWVEGIEVLSNNIINSVPKSLSPHLVGRRICRVKEICSPPDGIQPEPGDTVEVGGVVRTVLAKVKRTDSEIVCESATCTCNRTCNTGMVCEHTALVLKQLAMLHTNFSVADSLSCLIHPRWRRRQGSSVPSGSGGPSPHPPVEDDNREEQDLGQCATTQANEPESGRCPPQAPNSMGHSENQTLAFVKKATAYFKNSADVQAKDLAFEGRSLLGQMHKPSPPPLQHGAGKMPVRPGFKRRFQHPSEGGGGRKRSSGRNKQKQPRGN